MARSTVPPQGPQDADLSVVDRRSRDREAEDTGGSSAQEAAADGGPGDLLSDAEEGHGHRPLAPLSPAALEVCDALGNLMAFWGFQRSHGRIWALLFLSERPLHAGEIAQRLDLSAGQVSMSVRELEHWGVVHPERLPGQRRTWFRPETNLFRMVTRVFRDRELEQIRTLARVLQHAKQELLTQQDPGAALRLRRIQGLIAATELGRTLVERLVSGSLLPRAVTEALDRPISE